MKYVRRILYVFIVLMLLLFALIMICGMNPDITVEIADFLYRDKETETVADGNNPVLSSDPEGQPLSAGSAGIPAENNVSAGNGAEGTKTDILRVNGTGGAGEYIPLSDAEITVPENVSGRNGYQPVQSEERQIDDEESSRILNELGTGESGDGLDFDARFYPYYQMLDERGKHIYRQIYANANVLNASFRPVEAITVEQLKNVFIAVYNDHPELFWLETEYFCLYDWNGQCVQIDLVLHETANNLESAKSEFYQNADEIITQVQNAGSDYEKEQQVHNLLIERIAYDLNAAMNQSAYSALVNDLTVCAGYARAYQYLMQQLGIPCYYCTGFAGENHAWNIVELEDGYYNVDVTWDDIPGGEYDYFNKTDQDYAGTHLREELSVYLPACNGQLYRGADESELKSLEDAGLTEEDICYTMQEYLDDCYEQMMENGKGSYTFLNAVEGEELFMDCYELYQSEDYIKGYMERAATDLEAVSWEIVYVMEALQGDRYLITHYMQVD